VTLKEDTIVVANQIGYYLSVTVKKEDGLWSFSRMIPTAVTITEDFISQKNEMDAQ